MSDGGAIGASSGMTEEELSLPKATVGKLIQEMLPSDISISKESKDLLAECCVEFIHLISSEANEICEKEAKKTIAGDHVLSALKSLQFDEYVEEVTEVFNEHLKSAKESVKKSSKLENSGMTQEELLKVQEEMFANARQKLQSGSNSAS